MRSKRALFGVAILVILYATSMAAIVDPTRTWTYEEAVSKSGVDEGMLLKSIIYGDSRKVVQIGDRFYEEGSKVGDYKIMKIMPNAVVIDNGQGRTLKLILIAQRIKHK